LRRPSRRDTSIGGRERVIAGAFYQELYGFRHRPFALTPDPDFLYLAPAHQEALDFLSYALREGFGFAVLTGEVGTGKTTLVHALLARLPGTFRTAYLLNPVLSMPEILSTILEDLGCRPASTRKADLLVELNRYLLARHAEGGEVLVVIDEAQTLTVSLLEELRLLSNLETSKAKLLHLLLVGQPELDAMLDLPQLRQLAQRLGVRVRLRPLDANDTAAYIHHRLRAAGAAPGCGFTRDAAAEVFRLTGGIPRLINHACHAALVAGYVESARVISSRMVLRGWCELGAAASSRTRPEAPGSGSRRSAAARVALAIVLATAIGLAIVLLPYGHGLP
jgi:general secretion pathway protein A